MAGGNLATQGARVAEVVEQTYRQTSNISRTLVDNKIVDITHM